MALLFQNVFLDVTVSVSFIVGPTETRHVFELRRFSDEKFRGCSGRISTRTHTATFVHRGHSFVGNSACQLSCSGEKLADLD